jgi:hypothetical protein
VILYLNVNQKKDFIKSSNNNNHNHNKLLYLKNGKFGYLIEKIFLEKRTGTGS